MTAYLVDFENVKSDGLNGIGNLKENDRVFIFYSVNADKITFSLHKKINESQAKINYFKVEVGSKNALDFQLVSYLGYLICEDKKDEYVIVSNDHGFASVIKWWQKRNVRTSLVADLTKQDVLQREKDMFTQVSKAVEDEKDAKLCTEYILKYKTKQGLNNALAKVYGTTKGGKLYNAIKPLISDKKGN